MPQLDRSAAFICLIVFHGCMRCMSAGRTGYVFLKKHNKRIYPKSLLLCYTAAQKRLILLADMTHFFRKSLCGMQYGFCKDTYFFPLQPVCRSRNAHGGNYISAGIENWSGYTYYAILSFALIISKALCAYRIKLGQKSRSIRYGALSKRNKVGAVCYGLAFLFGAVCQYYFPAACTVIWPICVNVFIIWSLTLCAI